MPVGPVQAWMRNTRRKTEGQGWMTQSRGGSGAQRMDVPRFPNHSIPEVIP